MKGAAMSGESMIVGNVECLILTCSGVDERKAPARTKGWPDGDDCFPLKRPVNPGRRRKKKKTACVICGKTGADFKSEGKDLAFLVHLAQLLVCEPCFESAMNDETP